MNKIEIRILLENDLKPLAKLYKQFWNEDSNIEKMKIKYKELENNPNYIFLCAIIYKIVVGSVMGIVCEELYGECRPYMLMEDLVVDKEYGRMGIGKSLMNELEKIAKERDCYQMLFITDTDRRNAVSFYESLGFDSKTHIGFKRPIK